MVFDESLTILQKNSNANGEQKSVCDALLKGTTDMKTKVKSDVDFPIDIRVYIHRAVMMTKRYNNKAIEGTSFPM